LETDEQNLEQSASNNSVQKEIIADKEPSEQVNPSPVDSVKPTVPNLDLEKPASPETEMTSVEKTNQMIKQMKKAQYEVNKTYQNQIAEVESKL
jgi:RecA/RadA recombinase